MRDRRRLSHAGKNPGTSHCSGPVEVRSSGFMLGAHEAPTVVDHLGSRESRVRQAVTLAALMAASAVSMLAIAQPPSAEAQVPAGVGTLSIFAGTGTAGAPTAGIATSSKLNGPNGVAVDSSGNVYIADTAGNVVEKVTPDGTLSVFAGTGTRGAPTAGPATSSKLAVPTGVAVDSHGNVYIADTVNNVVEKVTPDGTLSVFAGTGTKGAPTGGPATSSNLAGPHGVAVDSSDNVYIADTDNHRIEVVKQGGNGHVYTLAIIAGTGTAGAPTAGPATSSNLNYPNGVAVDSSGNVYITDSYNVVVEKVTLDGTLSIFAGTGTESAPTAGPATSSNLNYPTSVAVDSSGNVYIADPGSSVVAKVTPSGTLSVFAGTGAAGEPTAGPATSSKLFQPAGVAFDSSGNVYIADKNNNVVEKLTPPDTTAPATPGSFSGLPSGTSNSSSVTIGFTLSESGGTVECKLDTGVWGSCTSVSGTIGSQSLTGLSDGSHSFSVRQTDAAGNVSEVGTSESWTVDTTAPDAPSLSGAPSGSTTSTSASIGFTGEVNATFTCSVDGGAYEPCGLSPKALSGLAVGAHSLSVKATDQAGNTSVAATASWTVAAPIAEPTVLTPAAGTKTVYKAGDKWAIKLGLLFSTGGDTRGAAQFLTVQVAVDSNGRPVSARPSDALAPPTAASFTKGVLAWDPSGEVQRQSAAQPVWVRVGNKAGKWTVWVKLTA